MDVVEHVAKGVLSSHGITTPQGQVISDPAALGAADLPSPCAVKAQVPAGGRGKAGGVRLVESASEAADLLGSMLGTHKVDSVLVEELVDIAREYYLAMIVDSSSGTAQLLFSPNGGVEIESMSDTVAAWSVSLTERPSPNATEDFLFGAGCPEPVAPVADVARRLWEAFRSSDAELLEINPLVVTGLGDVIALDAKLSVDDSAEGRQAELAAQAAAPGLTGLEAEAAEQGLRYIELDGSVGVLANGAGLTMTTMDVIERLGGRPANFLEIGGDAYTLAVPALKLVLSNPNVRSLVVNFCGAFARCDVMAGGVVEAWEQLKPDIDIYFSIHGTGATEARALVKDRLGIDPHPVMDDAIRAAIAAADGGADQ